MMASEKIDAKKSYVNEGFSGFEDDKVSAFSTCTDNLHS